MPLSNRSISEVTVPSFLFHQLEAQYTVARGNCDNTRWKEPRALNHHVEESYLRTENSCTRLPGEREIILWDIKPLKPRGLIVIVANITLIHRLSALYLFNYR